MYVDAELKSKLLAARKKYDDLVATRLRQNAAGEIETNKVTPNTILAARQDLANAQAELDRAQAERAKWDGAEAKRLAEQQAKTFAERNTQFEQEIDAQQ